MLNDLHIQEACMPYQGDPNVKSGLQAPGPVNCLKICPDVTPAFEEAISRSSDAIRMRCLLGAVHTR